MEAPDDEAIVAAMQLLIGGMDRDRQKRIIESAAQGRLVVVAPDDAVSGYAYLSIVASGLLEMEKRFDGSSPIASLGQQIIREELEACRARVIHVAHTLKPRP